MARRAAFAGREPSLCPFPCGVSAVLPELRTGSVAPSRLEGHVSPQSSVAVTP